MPLVSLKPFWQTPGGEAKLYLGDVLTTLKRMPAKSVQCVVTSPPYWGLRDYGTCTWEGGDPGCDHKRPSQKPQLHVGSNGKIGRNNTNWDHRHEDGYKSDICPLCGARRIDRQLGSEARPDCLGWARGENCAETDWANGCHVCRMVLVFREVRRVLRNDGVLWLNYGDTYSGGTTGGYSDKSTLQGYTGEHTKGRQLACSQPNAAKVSTGLPAGNLVGVPWRVAFALQADGWVLRSDVPWVKRSAMPESVRNRPAKALEYVFMLVKKQGYFFDMEAVRRPNVSTYSSSDFLPNSEKDKSAPSPTAATAASTKNRSDEVINNGRAFRNADLWFDSVDEPHGLTGVGGELVGIDVTSESYSGAHFATFGSRLITPLILAGTSRYGACTRCGAPWKRVLEVKRAEEYTPSNPGWDKGNKHQKESSPYGRTLTQIFEDAKNTVTSTVGWEPTCECFGKFVKQVVKVRRPVSLERTVPPGLSGPKGSGRIESGIHQGGVASSTLGVGNRDRSLPQNRNGITGSLDGVPRETEEVEEEITVYEPKVPWDKHESRPCVVLDPFMGSGTVAQVSLELGRWAWGIELSEVYLRDHAVKRTTEGLKSWPKVPPGYDRRTETFAPVRLARPGENKR